MMILLKGDLSKPVGFMPAFSFRKYATKNNIVLISGKSIKSRVKMEWGDQSLLPGK